MLPVYFLRPGRLAAGATLLALAGTLAAPARAQTTAKPTWATLALATGSAPTNYSYTQGLATDANGNVLVTGLFTGTAAFGSLTLTSAGGTDAFLAKWVPATSTWAWAVRAGGSGDDQAVAVAVRGTSLYVAGVLTNSRTNAAGVTFGPLAQYGAAPASSQDAFLAKYTDLGPTAVPVWTQVAGGANDDAGYGVAVSDAGNSVYLTGILYNNQANSQGVVFGGSGAAAGTAPQAGVHPTSTSDDLFVAKYTDNGSSATFGWSQVGGGNGNDYAYGVAVSGSSVYVAGNCFNDRANSLGVRFGGAGTTPGTAPQYGASATLSQDVVLAKYTDQGPTGALGWTQVAGGTGGEYASAVAASGSSVYVLGATENNRADANAVRFGGSGAAAGALVQAGASPQTSFDLLLAKYTDQGTAAAVAWTQVAGGTGLDDAQGLAVQGNRVYVVGSFTNTTANANGVVLGSSGMAGGTAPQAGASATTSQDVVVAGYLDNGPSATLAWSQVGGGTRIDYGLTAAATGTRLYVGGVLVPPATFGQFSFSTPANVYTAFVAALDLSATLATTPAAAGPTATVFPNPAAGPALLSGAAPATGGQVVDALGRTVATFRTDAGGAAALPAGLPPGLYLVRVGAATGRWVVE